MPRRPGDDALLAIKKGGTLLDVMWEELINLVGQLMEDDEYYDDDSGWDRGWTSGRATGVAWCIAVLTQSPRPINIEAIKEEAMERWEAEQADR